MLLAAKIKLDNAISKTFRVEIHTPVLGAARSILALSLFLTLLFNDPEHQFSTGLNMIIDNHLDTMGSINYFDLLKDHIFFAKWSACIFLLVVISGYLPQVTCFLQWYISYSYLNAGLDVEGGDQVISNISLLLIPICLTDKRINHWQKSIAFVYSSSIDQCRKIIAYFWFLLIKIQIAVIYFHAATGKFASPEWINGTAIYYWVHHPVFGMQTWLHPILDPLLLNKYAVFYITWGVVFLELALFISFFLNHKYFKKFFILGVGFHFAIVLLHGLFSFFISMTGALVLFYIVDYHNWRRERATTPIENAIYPPEYALQT